MGLLLQTRHLDIRPFTPADLDGLAALYADKEVVRFIADGTPVTRAETAEILLEIIEQHDDERPGLLACVARKGSFVVGRCGFKEWMIDGDRHVEIGWMVAPAYQGQGFGTEQGVALRDHAFATRQVDHVIAVIQASNRASIRVAEKVGGYYWRDWVTPRGHDVLLYRVDRPSHHT